MKTRILQSYLGMDVCYILPNPVTRHLHKLYCKKENLLLCNICSVFSLLKYHMNDCNHSTATTDFSYSLEPHNHKNLNFLVLLHLENIWTMQSATRAEWKPAMYLLSLVSYLHFSINSYIRRTSFRVSICN